MGMFGVFGRTGKWKKEGDLVSYTNNVTGQIDRYTLRSIDSAISNIKSIRDWFKTEEAYNAQLRHFQKGRSLFQ